MLPPTRTPGDQVVVLTGPVASIGQEIGLALAGREEVLFAILYGSAVTEARYRDFDVAVFVRRDVVPRDAEFDFVFALADELEQVVPLPVDVRVVNDAPLPFRFNVSRGAPLFIRDEELYYAFVERAWDEWLDFEPVANQYLRDMR
jgi:uncharacterized protein